MPYWKTQIQCIILILEIILSNGMENIFNQCGQMIPSTASASSIECINFLLYSLSSLRHRIYAIDRRDKVRSSFDWYSTVLDSVFDGISKGVVLCDNSKSLALSIWGPLKSFLMSAKRHTSTFFPLNFPSCHISQAIYI